MEGVSIIIPHYKTEILAKLCLRSIRRYTKKPLCEVIVVDNASSGDPSLDYLRRLKWIRLIERDPDRISPSDAHKQAVDIGIAEARFPYILSFHTDSIPIHEDWLGYLVGVLQKEDLSAVGSYKLELKSPWQTLLKKAKGLVQRSIGAAPDNSPYVRSHCALYRRDILQKLGLRFLSDDTAGRNIHWGLVHAGYKVKILPSEELLRYLVHLNHGTMVLRPELGARKKTIRRGLSRIESFLAQPRIRRIYDDASLDE